MLTLNLPYYLSRDWAPPMHSGTADFLPDSGQGEGALLPSGISQQSQQALPTNTWGAGWASAPNPGQAGSSQEILAIWSGLPASFPPLSADQRVPSPVRLLERDAADALFTSASSFKSAVAARQVALGRDVVCYDISGTRYADLNTNFANQTEGKETRDLYRLSDGVKVGEAFLYRINETQTVQHWVLFNAERLTGVRIVKRSSGEYASLSAFLSSLSSQKPSNVNWPHAVETVTHHLSCPW